MTNNVTRRYGACPNCGAAERHRLQALVLEGILKDFNPGSKDVLHFAPEVFFSKRIRDTFRSYKTSDLFRSDADIQADICAMPVADASFDFIYASHVLEHVPDDRKAIKEIYRMLRPGGIAVLPVPIYDAPATIEYGAPRADEDEHVRAPALDYFNRYREVFDKVDVYSSLDFQTEGKDYQLFINPMARDGSGRIEKRLADYVPACFKTEAT